VFALHVLFETQWCAPRIVVPMTYADHLAIKELRSQLAAPALSDIASNASIVVEHMLASGALSFVADGSTGASTSAVRAKRPPGAARAPIVLSRRVHVREQMSPSLRVDAFARVADEYVRTRAAAVAAMPALTDVQRKELSVFDASAAATQLRTRLHGKHRKFCSFDLIDLG
jgi:hypothetical protein